METIRIILYHLLYAGILIFFLLIFLDTLATVIRQLKDWAQDRGEEEGGGEEESPRDPQN